MGIFSKYPYTDFNDLNLDWILQRMREVEAELQRYLDNAVITFADPITWSIVEQYTALTVVVDYDGTAYLSKQPVPAGVAITNTDYWLPIFNYDDNINKLMATIAANERSSHTATADREEGDLVYIEGVLYKVLYDIVAGTAYIEGVNIQEYTVSERIKDIISGESVLRQLIDDLRTDLTTETDERKDADNEIMLQMGTLSGSFLADRVFRIVDSYDGTDHSVAGQGIAATNTSILLGGKISGADDSKQRISEYTMTGDYIRSHDYTGYDNHMNGITYDPTDNKIYATGYGSQIVVIDYTTLNVEGYLTTELDLVCGIDVYEGKLYVYGYYNTPYLTRNEFVVAEVNKATAEIQVLATFILPYGNPDHIFQDMAVYANYAYIVLSQDSQMMRINLVTGETDTPVYIGEGNGYLPYGECESGVFINGQMYMTSSLFSNSVTGWIVQVWKTNIGGSVTVHGRGGQGAAQNFEINVSKAITDNNPDGTAEHPFNTLTELSAFVNYYSRRANGVTQVTFLDGTYTGERLWYDGVNVVTRFGGCTIDRINAINGIYAFNGGTLDAFICTNARIFMDVMTMNSINLQWSVAAISGSVTYSTITYNHCEVSGIPVDITADAGITLGAVNVTRLVNAVAINGYFNVPAGGKAAGNIFTLGVGPTANTYFALNQNNTGLTRYAYIRTNGTVGHDNALEQGMWLFNLTYPIS